MLTCANLFLSMGFFGFLFYQSRIVSYGPDWKHGDGEGVRIPASYHCRHLLLGSVFLSNNPMKVS